MSEKPEALRLADALDYGVYDAQMARVMDKAAAELRRLHEAHDWQYRMAGERLRRVEKLEAQRDALLAVLKDIAGTDPVDAALDPQRAVRIARAAIQAVEGEGA